MKLWGKINFEKDLFWMYVKVWLKSVFESMAKVGGRAYFHNFERPNLFMGIPPPTISLSECSSNKTGYLKAICVPLLMLKQRALKKFLTSWAKKKKLNKNLSFFLSRLLRLANPCDAFVMKPSQWRPEQGYLGREQVQQVCDMIELLQLPWLLAVYWL